MSCSTAWCGPTRRFTTCWSWGRACRRPSTATPRASRCIYIDWNPETFLTNNVFHVTEEFEVERTASHETRRPDIVLFVNGIPLAVIECKRPDLKDPIDEAISQNLRNQRDDEIPKLFLYSQLLLAVSKNEAKYGTTGTALKFWSVWKEDVDAALAPVVNKPLSHFAEGPTLRRPVRLCPDATSTTWNGSPERSRPRIARCFRCAVRSGCST